MKILPIQWYLYTWQYQHRSFFSRKDFCLPSRRLVWEFIWDSIILINIKHLNSFKTTKLLLKTNICYFFSDKALKLPSPHTGDKPIPTQDETREHYWSQIHAEALEIWSCSLKTLNTSCRAFREFFLLTPPCSQGEKELTRVVRAQWAQVAVSSRLFHGNITSAFVFLSTWHHLQVMWNVMWSRTTLEKWFLNSKSHDEKKKNHRNKFLNSK